MKAVLLQATGGPEALTPGDIPTPAITQPSDVLVRLKAAGINPIDTKLRSRGTYYPDDMPAVLGCDGAGVVEEVGPAVARFKPGDAVYFCYGGIGGRRGNYAQYALIDEAFMAHKPTSLDFAEAAAVPLVLITAWESLHDRARVHADEQILIHAGAGGVGHVAIQLARLAGCRVATTVGAADKAAFAAKLGAELSVNYKERDFAAAVREWTHGRGAAMAFDTVGGATFMQTFTALRLYGDLVTLLQPGSDIDWKEARLRNLRISLELMLSPMYFQEAEALRRQTDILRQGAELIDAGKLKVHLHRTFPLDEAAAAHRLLETGGFIGKLALIIDA